MSQVRIQIPPGVEVDKTRLTSAVRFALQGSDPGKIWKLNDVPCIAQLEEAAYDSGMQDLAALYEEVVTGLDLPPDQQAMAVLRKGLSERCEVPPGSDTPTPAETAPTAPEEALLPSPEGGSISPDDWTEGDWARWMVSSDETLDDLAEKYGSEIHSQLAKAFRTDQPEASPLERRIDAATEEYEAWARDFDSKVGSLKKALEAAQDIQEAAPIAQEIEELHETAAAVWSHHREMIDSIYDDLID